MAMDQADKVSHYHAKVILKVSFLFQMMMTFLYLLSLSCVALAAPDKSGGHHDHHSKAEAKVASSTPPSKSSSVSSRMSSPCS